MNPVVKAQLKAFRDANPGIALKNDELFEVYCIYAISNGILTDDIDPFAAHLQGDEFGLDGISILVQGNLCTTSDEVASALSFGKNHSVEFNLFQAKTSEALDYGDLSRFFDGAFDFFSDRFVDPSDQIKDLSEAKNTVYAAALRENPTLRLFYCTTGSGEISKQIGQLIETNRTRFSDLNIFEEIEIDVLGAKHLQSGFRSATRSISEKVEINKPITLPEHPSVQQAFLGLITADQLLRLATVKITEGDEPRINRAVFFDNVRDFNPTSEINLSILRELEEGSQQSFVFKNNGVTVVAREINRKGDTFELEDYQIVNGCQTSNILFLAGTAAGGVSIPFRLIGSNDPNFIASIIVGTNKQNEVKEDQFWALTKFMKDLEEYSRAQPPEIRIFIERRENQYRGEVVERTRVCKPSDLVKAVAAMYLNQPHRAARDYRGVRKEFSSQIFLDEHMVVPYHAAAFANYRVDYMVRNRKVPSAWGIYKFYVLSAIGSRVAGSNIFGLKRNKQEAASHQIIETFADEVKLFALYDEVARILDQMIEQAKLDTREKIRDYIRSESVSKAFHSEISKP